MLKKLAQIAHELDKKRLFKEADVVTKTMYRIAFGKPIVASGIPGTKNYIQPFNQSTKRHDFNKIHMGDPSVMKDVNEALDGKLNNNMNPYGFYFKENRLINPRTNEPFADSDYENPTIINQDSLGTHQIIGPGGFKTKQSPLPFSRTPAHVWDRMRLNEEDINENNQGVQRFMNDAAQIGPVDLRYDSYGDKGKRLIYDPRLPDTQKHPGMLVGYNPEGYEQHFMGESGAEPIAKHLRRKYPSSIQNLSIADDEETSPFIPNDETLRRFHG